jgi:enoyl-CoA hydratase/carnithine racemase
MAETAKAWGMVNEIVPVNQLLTRAMSLPMDLPSFRPSPVAILAWR